MDLPNIGIVGKMGAGKTTVAKYLEDKYGYQRTSLAEPMRQIVKEFFGVEDKSDPRYRRLMQKLGTDWFRSEDKNVWIRHLLKRCVGSGCVVDDVRFLNEAKVLQGEGWVLLYIDINDEVRLERMRVRGDDFDADMLKHESEAEVELICGQVKPLWVVGNNGDLAALCSVIDKAMEQLLRGWQGGRTSLCFGT